MELSLIEMYVGLQPCHSGFLDGLTDCGWDKRPLVPQRDARQFDDLIDRYGREGMEQPDWLGYQRLPDSFTTYRSASEILDCVRYQARLWFLDTVATVSLDLHRFLTRLAGYPQSSGSLDTYAREFHVQAMNWRDTYRWEFWPGRRLWSECPLEDLMARTISLYKPSIFSPGRMGHGPEMGYLHWDRHLTERSLVFKGLYARIRPLIDTFAFDEGFQDWQLRFSTRLSSEWGEREADCGVNR